MHAGGGGRAAPRLLGALPGGVPAQTTMLRSGHAPLGFAPKSMLILITFWDRLGLDLSYVWAHWSAQVGSKIVFEPFYLRKQYISRNRPCSNICSRFVTQHGGRRWPKVAPRRFRDRLGSFCSPLDLSLCFGIVFGSALVPFRPPKWNTRWERTMLMGPWGVQDGLEVVWEWSVARLMVQSHFSDLRGSLLGSFWNLLASSGGCLGVS